MILHPSSGADKIYPICSVCGEQLPPSVLLQKSFLVDGRTVYVDFLGHTDCLKRTVIFGEESSPFISLDPGKTLESDKILELESKLMQEETKSYITPMLVQPIFSAPGIWSPRMMPKPEKEKKRRRK